MGSVGDIHIENYGTWRDGEGRLAWGVNDFDDACVLPYTHDLTRLATSALLARHEGHLPKSSREEVCSAILGGYERALDGPAPIVLAEGDEWLREVAYLTYGLARSWVVRRLAPDCTKIELQEHPKPDQRLKMLVAMARELVNVHAGQPAALDAIRSDWPTRNKHASWLERRATTMAETVIEDCEEWRRHWGTR